MFSVKNKITQICSVFFLSLFHTQCCQAGQGVSRALARVSKMWHTENAATPDAQTSIERTTLKTAVAIQDIGVQTSSETMIHLTLDDQSSACIGKLIFECKEFATGSIMLYLDGAFCKYLVMYDAPLGKAIRLDTDTHTKSIQENKEATLTVWQRAFTTNMPIFNNGLPVTLNFSEILPLQGCMTRAGYLPK